MGAAPGRRWTEKREQPTFGDFSAKPAEERERSNDSGGRRRRSGVRCDG
jgi:hypothetical protein